MEVGQRLKLNSGENPKLPTAAGHFQHCGLFHIVVTLSFAPSCILRVSDALGCRVALNVLTL